MLLDRAQNLGGHVFEFQSHALNAFDEIGEGAAVIPCGSESFLRNGLGGASGRRVVNVKTVAQVTAREEGHPAELAAAKHPERCAWQKNFMAVSHFELTVFEAAGFAAFGEGISMG